jgi:asparagine synthetase B (glutamine-hydrolysing)
MLIDPELIFVCRARLDDRAGLLRLLRIDAVRGATLSDAQIMRQCYKRWREETPQYVYGDFAFVAWERWSGRTVAATDQLGTFPLFYGRSGGRLEVLPAGHRLVQHEAVVRIEKWRLEESTATAPLLFESVAVMRRISTAR